MMFATEQIVQSVKKEEKTFVSVLTRGGAFEEVAI